MLSLLDEREAGLLQDLAANEAAIHAAMNPVSAPAPPAAAEAEESSDGEMEMDVGGDWMDMVTPQEPKLQTWEVEELARKEAEMVASEQGQLSAAEVTPEADPIAIAQSQGAANSAASSPSRQHASTSLVLLGGCFANLHGNAAACSGW